MKMYANDYLLPEKQNLSFIGPNKQNFFGMYAHNHMLRITIL